MCYNKTKINNDFVVVVDINQIAKYLYNCKIMLWLCMGQGYFYVFIAIITATNNKGK